MRRVVLGTIALDRMAGGLEKNIVLLANFLVDAGYAVQLITFDLPNASAFYRLDARVDWHKLGRTLPHGPIGFIERIALLRRMRAVLRDGDAPAVICFHHGILFRFWAAGLGTGARLVCAERNSLSLYDHVHQSKWSVNFLMMAVARRITVQLPGYVDDYPAWLRKRIRVIPNPVAPAPHKAVPGRPDCLDRCVLISVGRLCAQKHQSELVEAFARLALTRPEWDLWIVGDGVDHDRLQELIARLGIGDRVSLLGKSDRVGELLAASHLFCLPSRWEGFPNALAEAMAAGLPVVAFRDCAGASDLIEHGVTGRLAERGQLDAALDALMGCADERARMGEAAATAAQRYSPDMALGRWHALLDELRGTH